MTNAASNPLPRRVVRADIGGRLPTLTYTARPYVIAKFLVALKAWNSEYTVEVESVEDLDDPVPPEPLWRVWAWVS